MKCKVGKSHFGFGLGLPFQVVFAAFQRESIKRSGQERQLDSLFPQPLAEVINGSKPIVVFVTVSPQILQFGFFANDAINDRICTTEEYGGRRLQCIFPLPKCQNGVRDLNRRSPGCETNCVDPYRMAAQLARII